MTTTYDNARETLTARLEALGIAVTVERAPKKPAEGEHHDFHFTATVTHKGRTLLTTPYSMGTGHADLSKIPTKDRGLLFVANAVRASTESGKDETPDRGGWYPHKVKWPQPTAPDILSSLLLDSSVIDYPTYEEWAGDYGYEEDSRKGEVIYRTCLAHALALRSALGDAVLQELREIAQEM